jgi:hypothetical protein
MIHPPAPHKAIRFVGTVLGAYGVTAIVMVILAVTGLATVRELTTQTANVIFFLAFFPAILAGATTLFGGSHAKNNQ